MTLDEITVTANNLDLQGAADAYVAEHPDAEGLDLSPRWADEARKEVLLTVPVATIRAFDSADGPLLRISCAAGARDITPPDDCDLEDAEEVRFAAERLAGSWGSGVDWSNAVVIMDV